MFTVGLVVDDEAGRQVSRNDVFLDRIDYGVDGETIAVGMGRYQPKCARDCLFIFVGKFEPTDCESLPVSSDFGANPQILDLPDEDVRRIRSEEHTSELQSLMRISYAVFCLKKKTHHKHHK